MMVVIRYFTYGFILFTGILLVMDMPIHLDKKEPLMDYISIIMWGVVGGISFIAAYGCGWCLSSMIFGRYERNVG
jgi:hypothetical protein